MEFHGFFKKGGFDFGRGRDRLLQHVEKNIGKRFVLMDYLPESKNQRRFFHGAVLALWAYLDGNDYKNPAILDQYFQHAKLEFNPQMITIQGKLNKVGGSSKGKLGHEGLIEKVIENLVDNYGIDPSKCLNPEIYKYFKDKIYANWEYDTFIDYLIDMKHVPVIPKQSLQDTNQ